MKHYLCLLLCLTLSWPLAAAQRQVLPNGLTVLVESNGAADVVSARLALRVSSLDEPPELAGVRYLTQQLLVRGSTRRPGDTMAEQIDDMGATVEVGVDPDLVYVEINAPGDWGTEALATLAEIATQPAFPAQEFEAARQQALAQLEESAQEPGARCQQLFQAGMYGSYPYGRSLIGLPQGLGALTREQVMDFYARHYLPNLAVLAICGRIDPAQALAAVQQHFGGWRPAPPPPTVGYAYRPLANTGFKLEERPAAACYLMLGFGAPGLGSSDYPALAVLAGLLGQGMGCRLYRNVRDTAGIAYRVESMYGRSRQHNYFAMLMVTAPNALTRAKEAMVGEIRRLQSQPPTEQELGRARRYVIGSYLLDHARNRDIARYLAGYEILGVGYTYDEQFPGLVEKVTAEDLSRVARSYFQRYFLGIVMPSSEGDGENP